MIIIAKLYKATRIHITIALLFCLLFGRCTRPPEEVGSDFLLQLQEHNFAGAAELSTLETASLILFMEKMIIASTETGENLTFPIPPSENNIELFSRSEENGYIELHYRAGSQEFILYAININGMWKIHLPRSSW